MAHKRFYITPDGKIAVKKVAVFQDGLSVPISNSFNCIGEGGIWESQEGFFEEMNDVLSQLFSDTDTFLNEELSGGDDGGKGKGLPNRFSMCIPYFRLQQ